ncbi:MAG: GNAT family N-acetyltransferase, partial [Oscillospiraceae bacterium]|nr:GNAT family N-acetyltransferase [Oscillospiraceae bacterium]
MIYNKCYEIFGKCFPGLKIDEDTFKELCEIDECAIFTVKSGDEIIGFSMTRDNEIRLICVTPEYQRKGFGRTLLELAEGAAKDRGKEVTAGSPGSRLFIGAPEETAGFFERFGYRLEGTFAEMIGYTSELVQPEYEPRGDVRFEFRAADEGVINAVREVDDDWAQYFGEGDIFCGICGDEIASFCIL